jgi:hypothetical protein
MLACSTIPDNILRIFLRSATLSPARNTCSARLFAVRACSDAFRPSSVIRKDITRPLNEMPFRSRCPFAIMRRAISVDPSIPAPPAREIRRAGFKNHPARHYEYDCSNGGGGDPESSAYRTCRPRTRGWLKMQGGVGFCRSSILAEEISTADQANYDNYTPLRSEQMPTLRCILCRRRTRQLASAASLRDREALLIDQRAPRSRRP